MGAKTMYKFTDEGNRLAWIKPSRNTHNRAVTVTSTPAASDEAIDIPPGLGRVSSRADSVGKPGQGLEVNFTAHDYVPLPKKRPD